MAGSNKALVIDVETTTFAKGNPFSRKNELCYIGYGTADEPHVLAAPFDRVGIESLRAAILDADVIVGFNIKFDLHWLERYGITEWKQKRIWDLQIWEFLHSSQTKRMPSLRQSLQDWKLPSKVDIINEEYWSKGIDTPDIPQDLMVSYTKQDVVSEYLLFDSQRTATDGKSKSFRRLLALCNRDLLVLQEMEYSGQRFNSEAALAEAARVNLERDRVLWALRNFAGHRHFNPGSTDHVSALLFGGMVEIEWKIPYLRVTRKGEEKLGFRHFREQKQYERLVKPVERYKLKKDGLYSTSNEHLRSIRGNKHVRSILELLDRFAATDKLLSTYLCKLPALISEKDWEPDTIHGQFNQCVAVTGRLSSSSPNRQNEPPEVKRFYETTFA